MNDLQKIGSIAAFVNALAYVVGIGLVAVLLAPIMNAKSEQYLAFIVNNQLLMVIWNLIIYLITGVFTVPLALALHARLKAGSPVWTQLATAFGLIWAVTVIGSGMVIITDLRILPDLYNQDPARATTVYLALAAVERGLGGAIELPGGLWILLVSCAALQSKKMVKLLNYLGILIGVAGILTVLPGFDSVAYVFGLGAILWFAWVGIALLKDSKDTNQILAIVK
jgi:hypothetical protein